MILGRENFTEDCRIFYPFDRKDSDKFELNPANDDDDESSFPKRFRHEVVWEILQHAKNCPDDEKIRGVEILIEEEIFESAYPVHDDETEKSWNLK